MFLFAGQDDAVSGCRMLPLRIRTMWIQSSLASQMSKNIFERYAVTLAATLSTLLVCRVLHPFMAGYVPFILLFPACVRCLVRRVGPFVPDHRYRGWWREILVYSACTFVSHPRETGSHWHSRIFVRFRHCDGDGRGTPT